MALSARKALPSRAKALTNGSSWASSRLAIGRNHQMDNGRDANRQPAQPPDRPRHKHPRSEVHQSPWVNEPGHKSSRRFVAVQNGKKISPSVVFLYAHVNGTKGSVLGGGQVRGPRPESNLIRPAFKVSVPAIPHSSYSDLGPRTSDLGPVNTSNQAVLRTHPKIYFSSQGYLGATAYPNDRVFRYNRSQIRDRLGGSLG